MPPFWIPKLYYPSYWPREIPRLLGVDPRKGKPGELSRVYVAVAVIDTVGITSCVLLYNNRVTYRALYVHGRVLLSEAPAYLNEAAILHALRILKERRVKTEKDQHSFESIAPFAGSY